jgi:hypothetical protein
MQHQEIDQKKHGTRLPFYEIIKYFDIKLLIVSSSRNGGYELSTSMKTNVLPIWMCHVNVKPESW